jgi:hypothetical protein
MIQFYIPWEGEGGYDELGGGLLSHKCGHRSVLSKRKVWMSIFHIIDFKKKKILDFFNKKPILDYYFCLKSGLKSALKIEQISVVL